MTYITANPTELLQQASMTAHDYLREAVKRIDGELGEGYARKNPGLVGAFMQAASLDMGSTTIAKVIGEAIEGLADANHRNGSDEIAAALNEVARSIFKLGLGDATTPMGALEAHGLHMGEIIGGISSALDRLASAVEDK
jgi:hypothetical protein